MSDEIGPAVRALGQEAVGPFILPGGMRCAGLDPRCLGPRERSRRVTGVRPSFTIDEAGAPELETLHYPAGFLRLWRLRLRDAVGCTVALPVPSSADAPVETLQITLVRFREQSQILECRLRGADRVVRTRGEGMPFFVSGPAPRGKTLRTRLADVRVVLERRGDSATVGIAVYPGSRSDGGVLEEPIDLTPCVGTLCSRTQPCAC